MNVMYASLNETLQYAIWNSLEQRQDGTRMFLVGIPITELPIQLKHLPIMNIHSEGTQMESLDSLKVLSHLKVIHAGNTPFSRRLQRSSAGIRILRQSGISVRVINLIDANDVKIYM